MMIARLTTRRPAPVPPQPRAIADEVPWGTPYTAGDTLPPARPSVPAGTYTLTGRSGYADVVIEDAPSAFAAGAREVTSVSVTYHHYTSDGRAFIDGSESGVRGTSAQTGTTTLTWHEDLSVSGAHTGTRVTSPDGFTETASVSLGAPASLSGSMTTILDGLVFRSPVSGVVSD
jgi:hypothetical protein